MKNLIKLTRFFLIFMLLTSCKTTDDEIIPTRDSENQKSNNSNLEKSKMEIRVSCGEGDITNFINDGWIVVEEYSEEKVCTWRSYPATKNCDIEKDKGCKITKPDKIGEEKIYLLER